MILTALDQYYRRVVGSDADAPPPYGFTVAKVVGAIQLGSDGQFQGVVDLRNPDAKGKPQPLTLIVPQPPHRTVAVTAGFLCDNGGYLLGHDSKGKPERVRQQWQAAAELHRSLLQGVDDPAAVAILRFFETWDIAAAPEHLAKYADLIDGWLVFLAGRFGYAHEAPALQTVWSDHLHGGRRRCSANAW